MMEVSISIRRYAIRLDPKVHVFNVILENEKGIWTESFGSEEILRAYLRGVRAGANMVGGVFVIEPEIPQRATDVEVPPEAAEEDD